MNQDSNGPSWYEPLAQIISLGSTADRPGSLANLAQARREHLGQFFTPEALSSLMWRIASSAITSENENYLSVFDNSVGSGRLLQHCDPYQHHISGVDVHEQTIVQLREVAEQAGFSCEFQHCGMEQINPRNFSIGLINPPFSITLQSPSLFPFNCTTWGIFGANTSAISHYYALCQALLACEVVVAVLPLTAAQEVIDRGEDLIGEDIRRVVAFLELPVGAFREEGTEVRTALLVFSGKDARQERVSMKLQSLDDAIPFLDLRLSAHRRPGQLHRVGIADEHPSILTPVTGDKTVRVVHDGRKIKLKFACGLVEAKVLNAILRERAEEKKPDDWRLPASIKYSGQGVLDIEIHLAQTDPKHSFDSFIRKIEGAGGAPIVDASLIGFFSKRVKQVRRELTPLRHTVWTPSKTVNLIVAVAKQSHVVDPKRWGSPVIKKGQQVTFREEGGLWAYQAGPGGIEDHVLTLDEVMSKFDIPPNDPGWAVVHEGLNVAFPQAAAMWKKRMMATNIPEWLSWDFQQEDLCEFMLCPKGAVCGWEMGLGKSRLAYAMILLSGVKHGLIATEAYLVPEIARILKEQLPIDASEWQIIETPEQAKYLRKINIISTTKLRSAIDPSKVRVKVGSKGQRIQTPARVTFAHRLRGRIGLMLVDEGEMLSNSHSLRTRAVWRVRAKRLIVLTGTPIPNYPRNAHPILAAVAGNGTAAQPYGLREALNLDPVLINSAAIAQRGTDRFMEDFVTTEWVTREFEDDMEKGGKREVPKLRNLPKYRAWLSMHIKRRLMKEPDVARFVSVKEPVEQPPVLLEWDQAHLAYYLKVADEFAAFWQKTKADPSGRCNNMVTLLARINAVVDACNYPQRGQADLIPFGGLTSKQRWCINRVEELSNQGHRTILYVKNPDVAELFARELGRRGVVAIPFHGKVAITNRTKLLGEFRSGDAAALVATKGCTQAGLNIPEADRIIFYDRAWLAKTERQAIARAVRPEQTETVEVERAHLQGSIDDYMGQMCAFKADVADAGLDWATPELNDVEFLHLDTILDEFVANLAALHNMKSSQFRDKLKRAA